MPDSFYVAANAPGPDGGVYLCNLEDDGAMSIILGNDQLEKVMYITRSASNPTRIYASTALGENSCVASFCANEKSGALSLINQQPAHGASPCYVEITDQLALVANYAGGHVSVFPIDEKGALQARSQIICHSASGSNNKNQPHPHSIVTSPDGKYALCADLGLDELILYKIDRKNAALSPVSSVKTHLGAGPRHLRFKEAETKNGNGAFVYLINELDATACVFSWDSEKAQLTHLQTISTLPATLPKGANIKNSAADLHLHPSGKWLYASNRGHDSIAVMEINAKDGKLKLIQNESTKGKTPRGFILDPKGKFLLAGNAETHSVVSFFIDQTNGKIKPTGHTLKIKAPLYFLF